jgi:hypothetical protein
VKLDRQQQRRAVGVPSSKKQASSGGPKICPGDLGFWSSVLKVSAGGQTIWTSTPGDLGFWSSVLKLSPGGQTIWTSTEFELVAKLFERRQHQPGYQNFCVVTKLFEWLPNFLWSDS